MMLHAPVPTVAAVAPNVTCVNPQVEAPVISVPALAVEGFLLKVITTSSVDALQGALETVQRKVYVLPAVPVNVEVGEALLPNVPPVPLTKLHAPVPLSGVLAAKDTCVNPQVAAPV